MQKTQPATAGRDHTIREMVVAVIVALPDPAASVSNVRTVQYAGSRPAVHRSKRMEAPVELVAKDTSFLEINNELADKGFFVTSTEEMITWARTGSIYWVTFGLACCAIEMM